MDDPGNCFVFMPIDEPLDADGTPHRVVIVPSPSTGMWHVMVVVGVAVRPATIFRTATGNSYLYVEQWFRPDQIKRLEVVHASDEAVQALRDGGYEFADKRSK